MHICVVGAGPVGLLQCLYLVKYHAKFHKSLQVSIFERRSQQDLISPGKEGRSINLALSWRGMKALEGIGLMEEILKWVVPMRGRFIHPLNDKCYIQPYSIHQDQVIYSIERLRIQKILLKAVLECNFPQIKIFFRQQLVHLDAMELILDFTTIKTVRSDLIIGCDGSFSRVRTEMNKQFPGKVIQETFSHQYREFEIPITASFGPKEFLHIWPRKDLMLIALPNQDGSFTATLFCDFKTIPNHQMQLFFKETFPDFLEIVGVDRICTDWQENSENKLITVQVNPIGVDNIVLLGDAAHSILPFYGQGLNAGFEDVQLFTDYLLNYGVKCVRMYSKHRIPDAEAINYLAKLNYKEMRSQVLNPVFQIKTKILQLANIYFPSMIIPRYSMIAFTSIPYSKIRRREIIQDLFILLFIVVVILILGITLFG